MLYESNFSRHTPTRSRRQCRTGVTSWPLARVMTEGDPVVMPLKQRSGFALGHIEGPYAMSSMGASHYTRGLSNGREKCHEARWPRISALVRCLPTVFQVCRNGAEQRVEVVMSGKADLALSGTAFVASTAKVTEAPISERCSGRRRERRRQRRAGRRGRHSLRHRSILIAARSLALAPR